MNIFSAYPPSSWLLIFLAAFIIGLAKAGLKGLTCDECDVDGHCVWWKGLHRIYVLLLLCMADILAVAYYNRHAQWKHFWKLIPWMILGILIGVLGKDLNEALFRKVMAIIILLTILILLAHGTAGKTHCPPPYSPLFVSERVWQPDLLP